MKKPHAFARLRWSHRTRVRATAILSAAAWSLVCAFGLAACWDSASLNVATSDLTELEGGADASPDAPTGCAPPFVMCGSACVDVTGDPANCGGCGTNCAFPPPPVCEGSLAVAFGPGACAASKCAFQRLTMDCGPLNRQCSAVMGCTTCIPGTQDNDFNGSCTPTCAALALSCSGHGACTDGSGTATCVCDPGFTDPSCATNINDCAAAPCLNGGTCTDAVAGYTCSCVPGFTGLNCQTNINECAPAPCLNGGTCVDGINSYTCNCPLGFAGANCQTNIDDCAMAPCLNGGMCVDGVNSYTCNCVGGYSGANCQTSGAMLTGIAAHFDARTFASLTFGAGSTVTSWNDTSGNGRTLTVSGAAPIYSGTLINGRPGIDFGGARMITAAFPLTTDVTFFAVIQYRTQAQWGAIAHHGNRDTDWSLEQSGFDDPMPIMHWQSSNDNVGAELTFSVGTNYITAGRITGTLREFSSTSTIAGTVSSSAVGNSIVAGSKILYVGASDVPEFSNAYIGELIYYARSLSDAERAQVILYLQTAWGL